MNLGRVGIDEWKAKLDLSQRAIVNSHIARSFMLRDLFEADFEVKQDTYSNVDGLKIPIYRFRGENPRGDFRVVKFGLESKSILETYLQYYASMTLGAYAGVGPYMVGVLDKTREGEGCGMIVQRMDASFVTRIERAEDNELEKLAYNAGNTLGHMINMSLIGKGFCYSKNWVMIKPEHKRPYFKATLFTVSDLRKAEELKCTFGKIECDKIDIFSLLWSKDVYKKALIGMRDAFSYDREGNEAREYIEGTCKLKE